MGTIVELGFVVEVRIMVGVRVGGGEVEVDEIFERVGVAKATYSVAVLVGVREPMSRISVGVLRVWVASSINVGVGVLFTSSCKTLRVPATAVSN